MTFNTEVIHEPGGSVLRIASAGSLNVESGAGMTVAADQTVSGATTFSGAITATGAHSITSGTLKVSNASAVEIAADTSAATGANSSGIGINFGGGVHVYVSRRTVAPTESASPGSLWIRSDGSKSALYVNISSGTTGSVWAGASLFVN